MIGFLYCFRCVHIETTETRVEKVEATAATMMGHGDSLSRPEDPLPPPPLMG